MSIKNDRWITKMAQGSTALIEPYESSQVRSGVISYGVSSYGYDMRVAREFKIFTNVLSFGSSTPSTSILKSSSSSSSGDVHRAAESSVRRSRARSEISGLPRNVMTITVGKSTYARCGIITNVTPFEPEWEGHVTLEISNTTPLPAKIYANEGIAQVLFFEGDEPPETSYKDKKGKYQSQTGITLPKI